MKPLRWLPQFLICTILTGGLVLWVGTLQLKSSSRDASEEGTTPPPAAPARKYTPSELAEATYRRVADLRDASEEQAEVIEDIKRDVDEIRRLVEEINDAQR